MSFAFLRRPGPAALEIVHDGRALVIHLRRRPAARRLTLRVSSATGEVTLTLPQRASIAAAHAFAANHVDWISARLATLPERAPFLPGALIPLRGEPHRIVHRPGRSATHAVDGIEPRIVVSCEASHVPRRVRDYLSREARRDLAAAVAHYAKRIDRQPKRITLRDTRSRWGSCTASGELNFSWRLILAPSNVLDYLAAHEVAHMRELNHSPRFWTLLGSICPHVDEAERWLKEHGAKLHRYG